MGVMNRLLSMGVTLPAAPKPVAAYVPALQVGNLVYVSGQLPMADGKLLAQGPVPSQVTLEQAQAAARQCAINALAVLHDYLGDLNRIEQVVRLGAFVCCDAGYDKQPVVANGASEFLVEVFGDAGRHTRAAVGSIALPMNASVELDMIVAVSG